MLSESPVVTVHVPPALRSCVRGHQEVVASGETVGEIVEAVGRVYPRFIACLANADGACGRILTFTSGRRASAICRAWQHPSGRTSWSASC